MHLQELAKLLIIMGVCIAGLGLVLLFSQKVSFLGKLPGDIVIEKKNFTVYFPIATSIIISIVISLVAWLFSRR